MAEVGRLLLPKSKRSETDTVLLASIDLLTWFAADPERYRPSARRIPLLTQEGTLQASEDESAFLLPCSRWVPRAQPYQAVFPRGACFPRCTRRAESPRRWGSSMRWWRGGSPTQTSSS